MKQLPIDSLDQITQLPAEEAARVLEREVKAEREDQERQLGERAVAAAIAQSESAEAEPTQIAA